MTLPVGTVVADVADVLDGLAGSLEGQGRTVR